MKTIAFTYFTVTTFPDQVWGDGPEDPKHYNPNVFDARQWAKSCWEADPKLPVHKAKQ